MPLKITGRHDFISTGEAASFHRQWWKMAQPLIRQIHNPRRPMILMRRPHFSLRRLFSLHHPQYQSRQYAYRISCGHIRRIMDSPCHADGCPQEADCQ
ncbi:MAG: hypothetical protein ACFWUL_00430 [Dialister sp.]|mgnify:CR=1 FL=1|jgi:hypothetical protein